MGNGTRVANGWLARLAAARYARAGGVALLAAAAVGQGIARAVTLSAATAPPSDAALTVEYALPLSLFALLATVPLAVYRPAMAGLAVTFGNVLALASFGQVTAGGAVAECIAACWLGLAGGRLGRPGAAGGGADAVGRRGMTGRYLGLGLGLPFLVIALVGSGRAAEALAAAVPVAAGLGIGAWAARLARTRMATGEVLADTLLAHTARGERARIARELHDVVAHHISMIAVLAETGRLTTPGLPEAGARRFGEIGDTARAGLTEMRRLLGVLREDAESAAEAAADDTVSRGNAGLDTRPASRQPQPGITQLTGLVDAARDAAGTGMRLIISGPVAPLGPGVELAAYRITQEALTNARRHAQGAAVDVELRYSPDALRLRIRDNGPGPRPGGARAEGEPGGGGHGLAGMRERAFSVGGSLYTGVAPGGGFLVEAVLPAERETVLLAEREAVLLAERETVPAERADQTGSSGTGSADVGTGARR